MNVQMQGIVTQEKSIQEIHKLRNHVNNNRITDSQHTTSVMHPRFLVTAIDSGFESTRKGDQSFESNSGLQTEWIARQFATQNQTGSVQSYPCPHTVLISEQR
jgi:hypothetical protein